MLNELYTFAEPVQVVPFSSLKWGKFTLLHTDRKEAAAERTTSIANTILVLTYFLRYFFNISDILFIIGNLILNGGH